MRLGKRTGLSALVVEGDTHDLRLFSMNQVMHKLRDFIEFQELASGSKKVSGSKGSGAKESGTKGSTANG